MVFHPRLTQLIHDAHARQQLTDLTEERKAWLDWKPFQEIRALWPTLPQRVPEFQAYDRAEVTIGEDLAPDHPDRLVLEAAARAIMPWKKGPFRLFGIELDAEWRSDYKWDRLAAQLPDQRGKDILDVGCNNGYYLFRLLPQEPKFMLGIDPVPRLHYQFHLLQHYANCPNLDFQMWGWQEVSQFEASFDTIFCMGILYHHPDPISLLKNLYNALKPGGLLVLESIVIPSPEDVCLFPADRYANMRNVWYVPSLSAMLHMLTRCHFQEPRAIAVNEHRPEEQRSTAWNPGPSYENFLDPADKSKTLEGYPAPYRAIVFATKKG